jgi:hypothetical protein
MNCPYSKFRGQIIPQISNADFRSIDEEIDRVAYLDNQIKQFQVFLLRSYMVCE